MNENVKRNVSNFYICNKSTVKKCKKSIEKKKKENTKKLNNKKNAYCEEGGEPNLSILDSINRSRKSFVGSIIIENDKETDLPIYSINPSDLNGGCIQKRILKKNKLIKKKKKGINFILAKSTLEELNKLKEPLEELKYEQSIIENNRSCAKGEERKKKKKKLDEENGKQKHKDKTNVEKTNAENKLESETTGKIKSVLVKKTILKKGKTKSHVPKKVHFNLNKNTIEYIPRVKKRRLNTYLFFENFQKFFNIPSFL
ncbi:nucleolar protein Nop52, putative [Plasmodium malariae]|uniref:Nucleolar protein Nop52, putative n=1 Tax=Plasmodium malariae TaxID=5858 RepID=A0A1C3KBZ5_PLAMA|nr:nucleolar protein Nop52, putative [Plasmodium malariae]